MQRGLHDNEMVASLRFNELAGRCVSVEVTDAHGESVRIGARGWRTTGSSTATSAAATGGARATPTHAEGHDDDGEQDQAQASDAKVAAHMSFLRRDRCLT